MRFTPSFGLALGLTLCGLSPITAQTTTDSTRPLTLPPKPYVSCGTTIFPGNAAYDPKMPRNTPAGTFTMHVVTPTACRDMSPLPALRSFPLNLPTILGPKR
jgi:hypothetical protein